MQKEGQKMGIKFIGCLSQLHLQMDEVLLFFYPPGKEDWMFHQG